MNAQAFTTLAGRPVAPRVGGARVNGRKPFAGKALTASVRVAAPSRAERFCAQAVADGAKLDRKLRVAVVGGGPSGACAADDLAKGGVEVFMLERKMDNCKVRRAGPQCCRRSWRFRYPGALARGSRPLRAQRTYAHSANTWFVVCLQGSSARSPAYVCAAG